MSGPPSDRPSMVDEWRASYPDPRDADDAFDADDLDPDPLTRNARQRSATAERRRQRRRRWAVVAVVAVLLLPLVLAAGWLYFQVEPRGSEGREVTITVPKGASTGDVASALSDADVVGSTSAFKIWAAVTGATPFTPGTYTFRENMGDRAAANVLKEGPPTTPTVANLTLMIPPGLTLNQIADRVAQLPGRNRERFLQIASSGTIRSKYQPANVQSLEGLLFPDTYYIGSDEDEAAIIRKLVARFDEIGDRVGLANSAATNGLSPYQSVTAASLVQTEAKLAEDAPLMAAVIGNRLRDGMPLQIDSTLCYAKGGCPPLPTNADKAIDSPYNTYKVTGLPPTPISGVTEASLRATVNPANVPFKYYVVIDPSGKHAFATTLAEHEANVRIARSKGLL